MITYPQLNYAEVHFFIVFDFSEYEINKSLGIVGCSTWFINMLSKLVNEN